ncbi:MAG: heme-binding protein [Pseudomonadota bacterium]
MIIKSAIAAGLLLAASLAHAQQAAYGPGVSLEQAKKAAAAAAAEARKNGFKMALVVVDTHGFTVYMEVLDDTQTASGNLAIQKARTAAMMRRPSKALEDGVAGGRNALLSLPDLLMVEGGEPLIVGGKVIGAIGVSGASSAQDGQVARAGADALK